MVYLALLVLSRATKGDPIRQTLATKNDSESAHRMPLRWQNFPIMT